MLTQEQVLHQQQLAQLLRGSFNDDDAGKSGNKSAGARQLPLNAAGSIGAAAFRLQQLPMTAPAQLQPSCRHARRHWRRGAEGSLLCNVCELHLQQMQQHMQQHMEQQNHMHAQHAQMQAAMQAQQMQQMAQQQHQIQQHDGQQMAGMFMGSAFVDGTGPQQPGEEEEQEQAR